MRLQSRGSRCISKGLASWEHIQIPQIMLVILTMTMAPFTRRNNRWH